MYHLSDSILALGLVQMEWYHNLSYLLAAILFIFGIKGLTHPRTAVRGNLLGACGMALAAVTTVVLSGIDWGYIIAGILIGGMIGAVLAKRVQMTEMPELVALFNGSGGLASILVAGAEMHSELPNPEVQWAVAVAGAGLIGAVTFLGSIIAYAKLAGKWIPGNAVIYPMQQTINAGMLIACIALGAYIVANPDAIWAYWAVVAVGSVLGVTTVIRIGGGDMPVVISLLNSYSGLAAAATGFVISNNVLIVSGSLVGASGLILTQIMCGAMNRSLGNVLFGVLGPQGSGSKEEADAMYEGKIKSTDGDEVAILLDVAQKVVFVPGYGMAVAQAQHAVRDLANLLEERGVEVTYGIHPVAGRMPGHMNVLLAEADVAYDKLMEMDDVNPTLPTTDVAIVIGANDVVNPVARTDPTSPIAGMPIIDVDKARTVVMIKRSLSPGFAKIPNPLFAADNTLMFFSDGEKAVRDIITGCKDL